MGRGTIRELVHLCAGTDFTSTHLVSTHNAVGYGYIASVDGDIFFDDLGLKKVRFDQLSKNMPVDYTLENAAYRRASAVTIRDDGNGVGGDDVITDGRQTSEAADQNRPEPIDVVEESSLESFPASDSPAHQIAAVLSPGAP